MYNWWVQSSALEGRSFDFSGLPWKNLKVNCSLRSFHLVWLIFILQSGWRTWWLSAATALKSFNLTIQWTHFCIKVIYEETANLLINLLSQLNHCTVLIPTKGSLGFHNEVGSQSPAELLSRILAATSHYWE